MIQASPEHEQVDSWIDYCNNVKIFKKVLVNTSYSMYNKDKDKGVIKRSTYHEQVWRIFKKRKRISID